MCARARNVKTPPQPNPSIGVASTMCARARNVDVHVQEMRTPHPTPNPALAQHRPRVHVQETLTSHPTPPCGQRSQIVQAWQGLGIRSRMPDGLIIQQQIISGNTCDTRCFWRPAVSPLYVLPCFCVGVVLGKYMQLYLHPFTDCSRPKVFKHIMGWMMSMDHIATIGLFPTAGAGAKPAWQLAILLQVYRLLMHLLQQLHPIILEDLLYLTANCDHKPIVSKLQKPFLQHPGWTYCLEENVSSMQIYSYLFIILHLKFCI